MGFGVVVFLVASFGVLADWRVVVVSKSPIAFLERSDKPLDVYGVWL